MKSSVENGANEANRPAGVILAGGAGKRMGGNKPLYEYQGLPLISWARSLLAPQVSATLVNAGRPDTTLAMALHALDLELIFDDTRYYELGPLSGVHSALKLGKTRGDSWIATIPCDMPHLPTDLVTKLMSAITADAEVVHSRGEREYPLCALWRVTLLDELEARLEDARPKGGLSVMRFVAGCRVSSVVVSNDDAFLNINSPIGDPG